MDNYKIVQFKIIQFLWSEVYSCCMVSCNADRTHWEVTTFSSFINTIFIRERSQEGGKKVPVRINLRRTGSSRRRITTYPNPEHFSTE